VRRRDFIASVGSMPAWPAAARAQPAKLPVIGFLGDQTFETRRDRVGFFLGGLAELGFVPGRNVVVEYRWAEGHHARLLLLANQLVEDNVSVIAAPGSVAQAQAAMAATKTIPIVFAIGGDPVELGLVESLARLDKNVTGVTVLSHEIIPKRFELLHELLPRVKGMALLVNPSSAKQTEVEIQQARFATHALGLRLLILNATAREHFDRNFMILVGEGLGALVLSDDPLFVAYRNEIAVLADRYSVATMYHYKDVVRSGGLISYGGDIPDAWRRAGSYTGRILLGQRPSDLPVQRSTKLELAVNLMTAKALGLTVE
jgi:putative tryptophan/tyrosine transport system substrate-binding protein